MHTFGSALRLVMMVLHYNNTFSKERSDLGAFQAQLTETLALNRCRSSSEAAALVWFGLQ